MFVAKHNFQLWNIVFFHFIVALKKLLLFSEVDSSEEFNSAIKKNRPSGVTFVEKVQLSIEGNY